MKFMQGMEESFLIKNYGSILNQNHGIMEQLNPISLKKKC